MKVGGVSQQEKTDALFFKAVDRAIGNGKDFQSVLSASRNIRGERKFPKGSEDDFAPVQKMETVPSDDSLKETAPEAENDSISVQSQDSNEKEPQRVTSQEKKDNAGNGENEKIKTDINNSQLKPEISNEAMEALSAEIVDILAVILNMEPEQVENLLNETNINPLELLQPEKLMELLLATSRTGDITELLTNGELLERLKSMEEALNQLDFSEYGTTKEQIEAVLTGQLPKEDELNPGTFSQEALAVPEKKPDESAEEVSKETMPLARDKAENKPEGVSSREREEINPDDSNPAKEKVVVTDLRESRQSGSGDLSQEQGRETGLGNENKEKGHWAETRASGTEQFINQLAVSQANSEYTVDSVQQTAVLYREIANQIVQQIRIVIRPDQTSMNMQLYPEHLGRVMVNITAKNGVVTASFLVQNEIAKEAIEANLEVFKQNLNQQGTKVEAVEVDVADFGFEQKDTNEDAKNQEEQQQNSQNTNRRRQISLSELTMPQEMLTDEEQAAVSRMIQNGSTVEYTA